MAKGSSARHTGCRRGTKVIVKFRDGKEIIDVFIDRNDRYIFLKEYGRIYKGDIRSFLAYRKELSNKYPKK